MVTKSCKLVTGRHRHLQNIYLKDLTWSDNDNNMYLGPVVAAQQNLDISPQNSHPWGKRKGRELSICSQAFRGLMTQEH